MALYAQLQLDLPYEGDDYLEDLVARFDTETEGDPS